jgi:hypothetical protein
MKGVIYSGGLLMTPFKSFREQTIKDNESIIKCKNGKLHNFVINDIDGHKQLDDGVDILPSFIGGLKMKNKTGGKKNQCNPCDTGEGKFDCHYFLNFEETGGLPTDDLQMNLRKYNI